MSERRHAPGILDGSEQTVVRLRELRSEAGSRERRNDGHDHLATLRKSAAAACGRAAFIPRDEKYTVVAEFWRSDDEWHQLSEPGILDFPAAIVAVVTQVRHDE